MEKLIAGRRAGRRGVRHDGIAERAELRRARLHADRSSTTNGEYKMATWPVRVDGKTVRLTPAPLGQHTAEVLHNWLGIGAAEPPR